MISLRSLSLSIPMLALVAVLGGCASETTPTTSSPSATTQPQVAQSDTSTTPPAAPGRPGFGGPDMLVGAALHDSALNLTPAQTTTITNLKDSLHGARPAFDQAHASALAAAIRKGDLSSVQPPAPDQAKLAAHLADSAKAIQTLHDTLTADQRTQLVTDMQNHSLKGHHGGPDGVTAWNKG